MSDRILGAMCVMLGLVMALTARAYVAPVAYEPLGPSAFPLLLASLISAAGLWLLTRPRLALEGEPVPWKLLLPCAAGIVVYAVIFQMAGFIVATAVMAIPAGMAFGATLRQSCMVGVVLGVGFYLLFDRLLDVVLPLGVLALLGGSQ